MDTCGYLWVYGVEFPKQTGMWLDWTSRMLLALRLALSVMAFLIDITFTHQVSNPFDAGIPALWADSFKGNLR